MTNFSQKSPKNMSKKHQFSCYIGYAQKPVFSDPPAPPYGKNLQLWLKSFLLTYWIQKSSGRGADHVYFRLENAKNCWKRAIFGRFWPLFVIFGDFWKNRLAGTYPTVVWVQVNTIIVPYTIVQFAFSNLRYNTIVQLLWYKLVPFLNRRSRYYAEKTPIS